MSQVERENLVDVASREDYAVLNPDCRYKENIRNGEIIRGMNSQEVMASWGLPNVYLVSRKRPEEYWVYYVQDPESSSILIYTLTFSEDNSLADWDIDMKRFTDHSVVYNPKMIIEDRETGSSSSKK
ncbi:MAG TPA: hypothetical protein VLA34_04225 [Candidatus Krumholzibacterium sp.]|nr:hypothetical protein [Candidatus Krumholzibacterium sp.]